MNKKILLGSILSVIILILVSFTSVIGYRSVGSDVKVSPLFNIRSSKAIGKERKDIDSNYIGMGVENVLSIPKRESETSRTQKAIDIINYMDDKAFSKFVARIIFRLKNQEQMTSKEISETLQNLYYLRENQNDMKYFDPKNIPKAETTEKFSCDWFPGCNLILTIIFILADILHFFTELISCQSIAGKPCC
ncbi:MAG: hypothetical protein JSW06_03995 [Thermoplasmatales archaeon]|nr:MAG: hypothetical protein JSW06_03995 [Thermoplasmatales archaeon]